MRKIYIPALLMALLILLQIPFAEDSFAVSAAKHSAAAGAGAYRLLTGGTVGETGSARSDVAVSVPFSKKKPKVTVRTYRDKTGISWSKVGGAKYYEVYRSASAKGRYKRIKKTKKLSYRDASGESGKVYYYKVRAFKSRTRRSKYSKAVKFRTVYRVYIACGHGTNKYGMWDTGCTYDGMQEAQLMLPITRAFAGYMRNSGVYVYTDADSGNNKNRDRCIREANSRKISAYVSVHCDWEYAPSGTMPLYLTAEDRKLAEALNNGVMRMVDIPTRGLVYRTDLHELSRTRAVSCTFETGSIREDIDLFTNDHDRYGKGLAAGLCDYLGVTFRE